MPPSNTPSLRDALKRASDPSACAFHGAVASVSFSDVLASSVLGPRYADLRGRSVLLVAEDQLAAALALVDLDGLASRIVLCPPNLAPEVLHEIAEITGVQAIVSDRNLAGAALAQGRLTVISSTLPTSPRYDRGPSSETEWVLLTSGSTGSPKLVVHTLATLAGALTQANAPARNAVWSTFYDIRRYGGLQVFFRALIHGRSMVLSGAGESEAGFLARVSLHHVTHISGTPSHWRRVLMHPTARSLQPQYVRLSGEIADQSILSHLRAIYPGAKVSHAFASTEAGVGFVVDDGLAGLPASTLDNTSDVDMKVSDGTLRIRSRRAATRYLGAHSSLLVDAEGFVDTGDLLELRDGRYYFMGRRDGVINVGGLKVHPEEVEAIINHHPDVHMSLVKSKKNPITGALVVADVVMKVGSFSAKEQAHKLGEEIIRHCRNMLAAYKVPTAIHFVSALQVTEAGKLKRTHA